MKKILISAFALCATAGATQAHTGVGTHTHDFVSGFSHPITGYDHLLAMVAVGVFAALLSGRARWAVPLSFVSMMLVGGALGFANVQVPFVEVGILASVIVLGTVIALQWKASLAIASALVGVFAVFHGVAHGAEMTAGSSVVAYAAGFASATSLLHAAGLVFGLLLVRFAKLSGIAIALAGFGLALGLA